MLSVRHFGFTSSNLHIGSIGHIFHRFSALLVRSETDFVSLGFDGRNGVSYSGKIKSIASGLFVAVPCSYSCRVLGLLCSWVMVQKVEDARVVGRQYHIFSRLALRKRRLRRVKSTCPFERFRCEIATHGG